MAEPSSAAREPVRGDDDQQDTNWVPSEFTDTLKGGSGFPGSAVGYPSPGSGYTNEHAGFVGTRHTPDEDE